MAGAGRLRGAAKYLWLLEELLSRGIAIGEKEISGTSGLRR
jgi:hypothetical protein